MSGFRNILVGIDLARSKPPGSPVLDAVVEAAARRALWAARESGAELTFLSVLPFRGKDAGQARHLLDTPAAFARSAGSGMVEGAACRTLTDLARQAREQGIRAEAVLAFGQGWAEIVRQVRDGSHDLLVIGTHDPHGLRRLLLGSTARKLLHECPCPVWVSKPGPETAPRNILVASDLTPVSEDAVRLGLALGCLAGAEMHLLHAAEYPLDQPWVADPTDPTTLNYHRRVRAEAEQALRAQVQRNACGERRSAPTLHVVDLAGLPDGAILEFIARHHIDMLVLGTAARHGLWGALLGNTAERLLPEVPCSILAVRPANGALAQSGPAGQ